MAGSDFGGGVVGLVGNHERLRTFLAGCFKVVHGGVEKEYVTLGVGNLVRAVAAVRRACGWRGEELGSLLALRRLVCAEG